MKPAQPIILAAVLAWLSQTPSNAASLSGRVVCKGVRDSADAVVWIAAIPGKTFPAPKEHAKIDQVNLVFQSARAPGARRHDGRFPEFRRRPPQRLHSRRLRREVQPGDVAQGPDQELRVQEGVRRDAPLQGPPRDGSLRRGRADSRTSP